jgi:hypothetical protein
VEIPHEKLNLSQAEELRIRTAYLACLTPWELPEIQPVISHNLWSTPDYQKIPQNGMTLEMAPSPLRSGGGALRLGFRARKGQVRALARLSCPRLGLARTDAPELQSFESLGSVIDKCNHEASRVLMPSFCKVGQGLTSTGF